MASRAPTIVPAFKAQSFPFDISHLQQRVGVATASEELAPKAVKRKARITAKGVLITDGSGRAFRKTPDFEDVLRNLENNNRQVKLPARTVFIGAQVTKTLTGLMAQNQLPASNVTPAALRTDVFGQLGPVGATGASGASGAAGPVGPA